MAQPIELEQATLRARMQVKSLDGRSLAPLAECRRIGLTGLRATAATGLKPGLPVVVAVRLPSGFVFEASGLVTGCCTTLHLEPFGPTRGREDDAIFEIDFDERDPEKMWPIAALLLDQKTPKRTRPRAVSAPRTGPRRLHVTSHRA